MSFVDFGSILAATKYLFPEKRDCGGRVCRDGGYFTTFIIFLGFKSCIIQP
jgi:hypothetical protein